MSADIFKRKMAHAIQSKWMFLALKIFPRQQLLQIASKT